MFLKACSLLCGLICVLSSCSTAGHLNLAQPLVEYILYPKFAFKYFKYNGGKLLIRLVGQIKCSNQSTSYRVGDIPVRERDTDSVSSFVRDHEVSHPTTYFETLLHLFKANLGGGLFAMGDAVKNSGILVGPILIFVLGMMSMHCMSMLADASDRMFQKTGLQVGSNYPAAVGLCFEYGKPNSRKWAMCMYKLTAGCIYITQFGFCCVYLVFVSANVKQLMDHYGFVVSVAVIMCFVTVVVLLTCLIRQLKFLAPISGISMILLAVGVVMVVYLMFAELTNFRNIKLVASLQQYPLFFGTILFAFESIGMILPLKNEMKKPESFQKPFGVLHVGMFIVTLLYIGFGCLIYLRFGEESEGSVTLNLRQDSYLAQAVRIMISLALLLTYPIQFYVPAQLLWHRILMKRENMKWPVLKEELFRIALVLMTFVLAQSIPFLNLLITLVGSLTGTALVMILPPIIESVSVDLTPFIVIKNSIILLIGITGTIAGTAVSISEIVKAIMEGKGGFH